MLDATEAERPSYDPYLRSFHAAFEPELSAAIGHFRLSERDRVLDVPCGDGFYTALFARHMPGGTIIAADRSAGYLADAEKRVAASPDGPRVEFRRADVYAMPFADGAFDLVWCAQSMISIDDPVAALREIRRVLTPGGRAAVLETDEFHHVLLPWPVRLEVALQEAVRRVCTRDYGDGAKFAQARKLRAAFLEAELTPDRKRTLAFDRSTPFGATEREFLTRHFDYLGEEIVPEMPQAERDEFNRLTDLEQPDGLLNRADVELTVLASIHHARA